MSSELRRLEAEAVFVLREAAAQFERAVLLYSGGKDSICLLHLARKAFRPAPMPFAVLHIDTGHNFPETLEYRDQAMRDLGIDLLVRTVQDSIDRGRVREEPGPAPSRNGLQSVTLLDAIREFRFDAAIGGGRRDEEKARAKERIFSHRDRFGQWDPRSQRPELWNLLNGRQHPGEQFRVFPLSNWTELDVWRYLAQENVPLPSLYFAHERDVVDRDGVLLAASPHIAIGPDESVERRTVRFRTIGDMTCTGATLSNARTIDEVILEIAASRRAERGGRADDRRTDAAMEDRKRAGYF